MWTRRSHIPDSLTEADIKPKGRKILCNETLEDYFKELNIMVSAENLCIYSDWKITFTVHTNASDKHLGAVTSHKNKPI